MTLEITESSKQYHLIRLKEISKPEQAKLEYYVDGSVTKGGKPFLEEPRDEQKEWVLFRLSHCNTWPKVHENRIGDCKNWK